MIEFLLDSSSLLWIGLFFTGMGVIANAIGSERSRLPRGLGVSFTVIGLIITLSGTIVSSNNQEKQQSKLIKRTDEIAKLNKNIREKAEENSLLNSQVAHLQKNFVEKTTNQFLASQKDIKNQIYDLKIHDSKLASKIDNANSAISDIQESINIIIETILRSNLLDEKENANLKKGVKRIIRGESAISLSRATSGDLTITSKKLIIETDEIAHIFDDNLSIRLQKISEEDQKEILLARFLSPGKTPIKEKLFEVGTCISYQGFSIEVLSIFKNKAEFQITRNNMCGDSPH